MKRPRILLARDIRVLMIVGLFLALLFSAAVAVSEDDLPIFLSATVALAVLLLIIVELALRVIELRRQHESYFKQLQSVYGIYSILQPDVALPQMSDMTIAPDFGAAYIAEISRSNPQLIVELGSGVSSVLAGYAVRRNGRGRVIAVDHHERFAWLTRANVARHGLADLVEIRHAPLEGYRVGSETREWYSQKVLADLDVIDILMIDGPVDQNDQGHRDPALLELGERVSPGGCIVIDDTVRPRWRAFAEAWGREKGFECEDLGAEKGLLILRRPMVR